MNLLKTYRNELIILGGLTLAVILLYNEFRYWAAVPTFWTLALLTSLFYGVAASRIFDVSTKNWPWSQRVHQAWFNFIGCFAGWVAIFYLLFLRRPVDMHGHYLLLLIGLIGITGHLPLAMSYIVEGLKDFLPGLRAWTEKVSQKWFG